MSDHDHPSLGANFLFCAGGRTCISTPNLSLLPTFQCCSRASPYVRGNLCAKALIWDQYRGELLRELAVPLSLVF